MTSLELVNRILMRERALVSLYSQLEDAAGPAHGRTIQTLRRLQIRQISILEDLQEELEREAPAPPVDRIYAQHILQPGETLTILARLYSTTVSEIRRVNPDLPADPGVGQVVNLPIEIPRPPRRSTRYVVRQTDTLFSIARRFSTDVETLVKLNSIDDPDVIFPGRILIIPRS